MKYTFTLGEKEDTLQSIEINELAKVYIDFTELEGNKVKALEEMIEQFEIRRDDPMKYNIGMYPMESRMKGTHRDRCIQCGYYQHQYTIQLCFEGSDVWLHLDYKQINDWINTLKIILHRAYDLYARNMNK